MRHSDEGRLGMETNEELDGRKLSCVDETRSHRHQSSGIQPLALLLAKFNVNINMV